MISLLRERRNRGLGEEMISVDLEANGAVFAYEEGLISAQCYMGSSWDRRLVSRRAGRLREGFNFDYCIARTRRLRTYLMGHPSLNTTAFAYPITGKEGPTRDALRLQYINAPSSLNSSLISKRQTAEYYDYILLFFA